MYLKYVNRKLVISSLISLFSLTYCADSSSRFDALANKTLIVAERDGEADLENKSKLRVSKKSSVEDRSSTSTNSIDSSSSSSSSSSSTGTPDDSNLTAEKKKKPHDDDDDGDDDDGDDGDDDDGDDDDGDDDDDDGMCTDTYVCSPDDSNFGDTSQKLYPFSMETKDARMGRFVSFDRNFDQTIVGGPGTPGQTGFAYVHAINPATNEFEEIQKVIRAGVDESEFYGHAVGISGVHAVIGSPYQDYASQNVGGVYTYLVDFEDDDDDDDNGICVELDEQICYEPEQSIDYHLHPEQFLLHDDPNAEDRFGFGVSIDGEVMAIGSRKANDDIAASGAVYVYRFQCNEWVEEAKLTLPPEGVPCDNFGTSVSIHGNRLAIGAPNSQGSPNSGQVFIYDYNTFTEIWELTQTILPCDGGVGMLFGQVVHLDGDQVIIGRPADNEKASNAGSAYIYKWDGFSWVKDEKIFASDPAANDYFGAAVTIKGDIAAVGAPIKDGQKGAAYLYERSSGSWVQFSKETAFDVPGDPIRFGVSVSTNGERVIVGAERHDTGSYTNAGAVYDIPFCGHIPDEPCGECKGKVSDFTIEYHGVVGATIKVIQKNGDIIFDSFVAAGAAFTLWGTDNGSFGKEIQFYIDGVKDEKIHTSCSKDVGPGFTIGLFEVVAGESKDGGDLCPFGSDDDDDDDDD